MLTAFQARAHFIKSFASEYPKGLLGVDGDAYFFWIATLGRTFIPHILAKTL
jgi:hypothetical protein